MKHLKNWKIFNEGIMLDLLNSHLFGGKESVKKDLGESPVKGEIDTSSISGDTKKNVEIIKKVMEKHGMTNPYLQVAILGCIGKESGFVPKPEQSYSGTSNNRIRQIFRSKVSDLSDSEIDEIKKDEEQFFEKVYGGRFGNTKSGDGYKYRGRGYNQLTFKDNYKKMQEMLSSSGVNVDIVNNPDKVNDPEIAAEVAILFFKSGLSGPKLYQNFGIKDPNQFKSKEDAIQAVVNVNAGWKNIPKSDKNYTRSVEYANKFPIDKESDIA